MKYSLTTLFRNSNMTLTPNPNPNPNAKRSTKSLDISSRKLWKFFVLYEFFTVLVNLVLVSSEFWQSGSYFSENRDYMIINITLRCLQIISILIFGYWTCSRRFHRGNAITKCFLLVNGFWDLLMFCHVDSQLVNLDKNQIFCFFTLFKLVIYTFFLEKLIFLNITSAASLLYYLIWDSIKEELTSYYLVKAIIYCCLIILLIFGSSYILKTSVKKANRKETKQKLFKTFINNPFLELIPEGVLLVKSSDLRLIYHNQYLFRTLEVTKFYPKDIDEISQYMTNFIHSRKEDSRHTALARSRSSRCNNQHSLKTFSDLNEVLTFLKDEEIPETDEDVDESPQYFIATRIDLNAPNAQLFQIELTIKKIFFKNERYFVILMQSMKTKKMLQELKDKDDFKTRLLSSFSHELKTPLNGTIPCLELLLLEDGIEEEFKEKYIKNSLCSLKLLQNTINDIIDYSMISSEQFILNIKPINIMNILLEIGELIKPQLTAKNISFSTNFINMDQSPIIYSDSNRINRILVNLLINALKFTNSGGSITLNVTNENRNFTECLSFELIDTGIGMNEEQLSEIRCYLKRIMVASEQNFSLNLNSTGSGFGLLICQNIVLILGEENDQGLKIDSKENEGTTVRFSINDKKPKLLESKSSFSHTKSLNPKTTVVFDSVKIEFRRQLNISLKKSHQTESISSPKYSSDMLPMYQVNSPDVDSVILEQDIDEILKNHNFNDGIKFIVSKNLRKRSFGEIQLKEASDVIFDSLKKFEGSLGSNNFSSESAICDCEDVLTVDDDIFNLLSLEMLLKTWGLKTKKAMNGEEAIKIVKAFYQKPKKCCKKFKAILMDFQMPIKDGVEATKELIDLMKSGKIPFIPIIGCTAFETKAEVNKCFEAGMKDVVFKPLNKQTIAEIVSTWIL